MLQLKSFTAVSDQGPSFQLNEDALEIDLKNNLFLVVDGFGGTGAGDVVAKIVKDSIKNFYTRFGGDIESTLPFYFSQKFLIEGNALINSMYFAQEKVLDFNKGKDLSKMGGASCLSCSLSENIITFVSVGNCYASILRGGRILPCLLPDCYDLFDSSDPDRPWKTYPLSALGLFQDIHINAREIKLIKDDIVVLVTDGVYSKISDKEIVYILSNNEISISERVDKIFGLANSKGNLDNQTMVLLQF